MERLHKAPFWGEVWCHRGVWHYQVVGADGKFYAADNTRSLPLMHENCSRVVASLNRLFGGCDNGLRLIAPAWLNEGVPPESLPFGVQVERRQARVYT